MHKNVLDQCRAVIVTIVRSWGIGVVEPVQNRVENARMSQTRLKALEKLVDKNDGAMGGGLMAAERPGNDAVSKIGRIDTLAAMSHFRLSALAAVLPAENIPDVSDDEFLDPKERRARELAAKYC